MKKKNLLLCGVTAGAVLALASCGGGAPAEEGADYGYTNYTYEKAPADVVYENNVGELDISVNYQKKNGITFTQANAFPNPVDKITYNKGALLPTWKRFGEKIKATIIEASNYQKTEDEDKQPLEDANFMSYKRESRIDCLYQKTGYIEAWGKNGKMVALDENFAQMPNFKKYLDANPAVKAAITSSDNHIYYTPYFDSYNEVEHNIIIDTEIVEKVLDATSADLAKLTSTKLNGGANPASNLITKKSVDPFIDPTHNYPDASTSLQISKNGVAATITVAQQANIIVTQNALLDTGVTGKALLEGFQTYLKAAFAAPLADGTYSKLSEIFTSESAAFNTDELIALMRVVKANPELISGDPDQEIVCLMPRGQNNGRIDNVLQFVAQIYGVTGFAAEKEKLYFDANGKLHDARTTEASYDMLACAGALYDEGLIVKNFWTKGNADGNFYVNKYFAKTTADYGYGLLEYDYTLSQSLHNDMVDGFGVAQSKRTDKNVHTKGITPMLPPLTYWPTGTTVAHDQALADHTGKSLIRHVDDNRGLKDSGFAIPNYEDTNKAGALRMLDYLFSKRGLMIQDYGPEEYWNTPDLSKGDTLAASAGTAVVKGQAYVAQNYYQGESSPIMNNKLKAMYSKVGGDFWTFMRVYLGSTHGIGHEREKSIQVQALNAYGAVGYFKLSKAIASGVVTLTLDKEDKTWNSSVPTGGWASIDATEAKAWSAVTKFWARQTISDSATGWILAVKTGKNYRTALGDTVLGKDENNTDFVYQNVLDQISLCDKGWLYQMAGSYSATAIPDYAKNVA